ncbi:MULTISPECIES: 1-aminocyclopropane-1-carboxylate deaminase/D-cysteine desulfhydrase [Rheinheimera]|uniref:1-aminocyclopropane-1-carboxylate deaminase/D-cysteine desulfhydrase n=1 Tax=Rheinheimera marina TaxID=1774958 RepID=A0ABV9JHJ0_9GAMM
MVLTTEWQLLSHPVLCKFQHQLWICQIQSQDPQVSGNKALKLKYQLAQAVQTKNAGLLTLGGAFSNHLAATAAACHSLGLASIGLVRTDAIDLGNPTLSACQQNGMQLIAVSREHYRQRDHLEWQQHWQMQFPDYLFVPEGGTSEAAVRAVSEFPLGQTPAGQADCLVSAVGSGGTLAGLIRGAGSASVLGIQVAPDPGLSNKISRLTEGATDNWQLQPALHLPAYGKVDNTLWEFCALMKQQGIELEPIYTGKALYNLLLLIEQGLLGQGKRISFFHTGGLQGLAGLAYRGLIPSADFGQSNAPVAG